MREAISRPITGWAAILLALFLLPITLVAQLLPIKKTKDRTAAEVAGYLRDFIAGTGGERDWDDFESVPITDAPLDQVRREAALAGPPNADLVRLKYLLAKVERMIAAQTSA